MCACGSSGSNAPCSCNRPGGAAPYTASARQTGAGLGGVAGPIGWEYGPSSYIVSRGSRADGEHNAIAQLSVASVASEITARISSRVFAPALQDVRPSTGPARSSSGRVCVGVELGALPLLPVASTAKNDVLDSAIHSATVSPAIDAATPPHIDAVSQPFGNGWTLLPRNRWTDEFSPRWVDTDPGRS